MEKKSVSVATETEENVPIQLANIDLKKMQLMHDFEMARQQQTYKFIGGIACTACPVILLVIYKFL